MRSSLISFVLLVLAACSSTATGPADAGSSADAVVLDAAAPDASSDAAAPEDAAPDASALDAAPLDAAPLDAAPLDAAALDAAALDAAPLDAQPSDSGVACAPIDLEIYIVHCPAGFEYARHFVDPASPALCPDYVELLGQAYPTLTSAISGAGCDPACVYAASMSVSFIDHCGHRNGYIVYRAAGCDDLYEFSNGLFPSVAAWEEATPCGG